MKQKVSIKKIADVAGVSTCTVSKVMNNTGTGYSERTAQKIRAVAESLNYIPDSAAKTLRESKSYTIGLIVPDISNNFFASLSLFIEQDMREKGYSVFIANGAGNAESEEQYFRVLAGKGVDGIISCSGLDSLAQLCQKNGIPLVCVGRYPKDYSLPVVAVDNMRGGITATEHLIECGCRNILFLGYATAEENRAAREDGYFSALQKHGLKTDRNYAIYCDPTLDRSAAVGAALADFLATGRPVDGIFASNDSIALGALTHLMRHGYRIPRDVKIVGFDNSYYSSLTYPGISTIDIHADRLAKASCTLMQNIMRGKTVKNGITYVPFDLVLRESTGDGLDLLPASTQISFAE